VQAARPSIEDVAADGVAVRLTAAPLTRPLAEHVPVPLLQLMLVEPAVPLTVPPEEVTVSA